VNSASAHTPLAAAAIVAITTPTVDSDAMRHPRPRIVIKLGRELTVLLARELTQVREKADELLYGEDDEVNEDEGDTDD
jgi:hypothetical protein